MVDFIKKVIKETLSMEIENPRLMEKNEDLNTIKDLKGGIENKLKKVLYKKVTGKELDLPKIDIKIDDTIKNGKIAFDLIILKTEKMV